jgi:hypothetical protein
MSPTILYCIDCHESLHSDCFSSCFKCTNQFEDTCDDCIGGHEELQVWIESKDDYESVCKDCLSDEQDETDKDEEEINKAINLHRQEYKLLYIIDEEYYRNEIKELNKAIKKLKNQIIEFQNKIKNL